MHAGSSFMFIIPALLATLHEKLEKTSVDLQKNQIFFELFTFLC